MEKQTATLLSVIFADDDADDKDIFCEALKELNPGINVTTVPSGKALLDALQASRYDLVFLDINMFPVDGFETLRHIRSNKDSARLPVIMYSSSGRPMDWAQSHQLGANLFIRKTETYQELKATLAKTLDLDWSDPDKIRQQYFQAQPVVV